MRYLQPLPRSDELDQAGEAVAVVAGGRRRVLYVEGDASLDVIVAALEAWGLRVRAERERRQAASGGSGADAREAPGGDGDGVPAWVTRRPALPRVSRLENVLSPLWFPARRPASGGGAEAGVGRAGQAA